MPRFDLDLKEPVRALRIEPGSEIKLRGSFVSTDGAVIDAATSTWPDGDGAGVDAGGLIDFAGGGLHMTSRDPVSHEVVAVATGQPGPACQAAAVASPCLVLRTAQLARTRLMTREELSLAMKGSVVVEIIEPPPPPPPDPVGDAVSSPWFAISLSLVAGAGLLWAGLTLRKRAKQSPRGQLEALIARVRKKLERTDPVLAATMKPAIDRAGRVVSERTVDLGSPEGTRIRDALGALEASLDQRQVDHKRAQDRAVADEILIEMESALEAATEAGALAGSARAPVQ